MDWDKKAAWTIEDMEGNSLTVRDTLFYAYYKARALDMKIAGIREISPSEYELVDEDGAVVNTITNVGSIE